MKKTIAVLPGDGVGPEVIKQGIKVLEAVSKKYNIKFEYKKLLIGGIAIDKTGCPLAKETIELSKESDAILLGTVGGYKWDNLSGDLRPEAGLLAIRKEFGVFANLRPAFLFPQLKSASCLKEDIVAAGIDLMIVRELTGGAYFGEKKRENFKEGQKAWDTIAYSSYEIERILRTAYKIANKRKGKLTMVDKANVLESSRLWRDINKEISKEYPMVETNYMYVDNAAMQLIKAPSQFDVIVTENMFGDILSDEVSAITGSLGMLPSASIGHKAPFIYEPIHGSAPDIAGKNKSNPIGTIMSIAMMLEISFNMEEAARDVRKAVEKALDKEFRTFDIMEKGMTLVGTEKMGHIISENINI